MIGCHVLVTLLSAPPLPTRMPPPPIVPTCACAVPPRNASASTLPPNPNASFIVFMASLLVGCPAGVHSPAIDRTAEGNAARRRTERGFRGALRGGSLVAHARELPGDVDQRALDRDAGGVGGREAAGLRDHVPI